MHKTRLQISSEGTSGSRPFFDACVNVFLVYTDVLLRVENGINLERYEIFSVWFPPPPLRFHFVLGTTKRSEKRSGGGGNQTNIFRADRQYDVFDIHVFLKFIRYIFIRIRPIKILTQGVPHNLTSQHQGCSKGCSIATCANDNANIKKMCGIKVFLNLNISSGSFFFEKCSLKIEQGVCELIFINRF